MRSRLILFSMLMLVCIGLSSWAHGQKESTCTPNPLHLPCNQANPGVGGCEDLDCCRLVCAEFNALCCEDLPLGWIQQCADFAIEIGCPTCSSEPPPDRGVSLYAQLDLNDLGGASSYQLMQIEQVMVGYTGSDFLVLCPQAIQLRMRSPLQNQMQNAKLWAWDATGANPILLVDFDHSVPNLCTGARVLVTTPCFDGLTYAASDFTMTNLVPESYGMGGSITFENNLGTQVLWRLSWGTYSGDTTGATTNDADGEFAPPWPGLLPGYYYHSFDGDQALPEMMNDPEVSGEYYFDREKIRELIKKCKPPKKDVAGFKTWAEFNPQHLYAGGADTAEGIGEDVTGSVSGVEFVVADSRDRAISYIENQEFDFIICDLMIPPSSGSLDLAIAYGLLVYEKAKTLAPGMPV